MRRRGIAANATVLAAIVLASFVAAACTWVVGLSAPTAAGIFAGGLTNTPALAAALDCSRPWARVALRRRERRPAGPVGDALALPLGVLLPLLACHLLP